MKSLSNSLFFIQEFLISCKQNYFSHAVTVISIGLAFTILGVILSFWWSGQVLTDYIKDQGEIMVFYSENISDNKINELSTNLSQLSGVKNVYNVDKDEAKEQMNKILGEEGKILDYFEDNPLSPYFEVNISVENINHAMDKISQYDNVEHTRTNTEVLAQMESLTRIFIYFASLFATLTAISIMIITSHIIRLGLLSRQEEISTLQLLGATRGFIAIPFVMEGTFLGALGGLTSGGLLYITLPRLHELIISALPFIPIPTVVELLSTLIISFTLLGAFFGCVGSSITLLKSNWA
ncbi:cell division protein FtsX [Natranaerobius thermophilus]|uniref:Cell division protein FtsX n=1 Tax=Natranaerobius thermophilus (strain ATCC BAA-1301 / DSM 18059 / JW/NM-WN-LF) TaxID=457570 RepID=B2A5H6_NATTJ|nr:permease-like cell division protein FtsX [Natranaerobius thermophilus]ACB85331.1 protein of unknown function DUF214 [Natranaerobius thermophilus JW/NM-WN-LF]